MHAFHESVDERLKGCVRCGRLPGAHQKPLRPVKNLGPCSMCGQLFKVDMVWWLERVRQGLPELEQCARCHAYAHHGAPVVS